jgi:hypothetical protein
MPMEIFVSCVGDLATVGGSVVVVTPVRSPPGSLDFVFSCEALGIRKFLPWSRTARTGRCLSGHILGRSVSALPVYSFKFTDYGLPFTVCFNLAPWTGNPPHPLWNRLVFVFFGNFLGVQSPLFLLYFILLI